MEGISASIGLGIPELEAHTMITETIVQDMTNNGITVNSVIER